MKTRGLLVLGLCTACTPELTGDVEVLFQSDTSTLEVAFTPHEGRGFEPGTVFVELLAHGADVSRTANPSPRTCVALPANGRLTERLRNVEWNASVAVIVWHDEPPSSKDLAPGAAEPEPRPCAGTTVVSETWSNDATPTGQLDHPDWIDVCDDRSQDVTLRNIGDGDLVIKTIAAAPAEMAMLSASAMPRVLSANESLVVSLTLGEASTARGLLRIETDDPRQPWIEVPISIDAPRLDASTDLVRLGPDQLEAKVDILNVGCGSLSSVDVTLHSVSGADDPILDDLTVVGCDYECTLEAPRSVTLRYTPDDAIDLSVAMLTLSHGNDRTQIPVFVDDHCDAPVAAFRVETSTPCAERPVDLVSETPDAASHEWRVTFPADTTIEDLANGRATFTPDEPGPYVVELSVVNSCGARSKSAAVRPIDVQACPE